MRNEDFKGVMNTIALYDGVISNVELLRQMLEIYNKALEARCIVIPSCSPECPFWTNQIHPEPFCLRFHQFVSNTEKFPDECKLDSVKQWKEVFEKLDKTDEPLVKKMKDL